MNKPFTVEQILRKYVIFSPFLAIDIIPADGIREIANEISEQSGWVKCSDRLPTKEDADENGRIEFWYDELKCSVSRRYYAYLRQDTHWRKIVKPEN